MQTSVASSSHPDGEALAIRSEKATGGPLQSESCSVQPIGTWNFLAPHFPGVELGQSEDSQIDLDRRVLAVRALLWGFPAPWHGLSFGFPMVQQGSSRALNS